MKTVYLEKARNAVERVQERLSNCRSIRDVELAGEYRRCCEAISVLDFVVLSDHIEGIAEAVASLPFAEVLEVAGGTLSAVLDGELFTRFHIAAENELPFLLNALTGSAAHVELLRRKAGERRIAIADRCAFSSTGEKIVLRSEAELYTLIGADFVEPELRDGTAGLERALCGTLPCLVKRSDLRGTFHCHTVASDGGNTLEEMALAARGLGFEYLGIADHSRSSHKGLDSAQLLRQKEEIQLLNQRLSGIQLFSGIEVDILPDGTLDLPDETLAQMDFVVASLHTHLLGDDTSEATLTDRLIRVMSNPYVTMMGHVTSRVVAGRHDFSYKVNIPAIIDAAAATGTIIELNSAPFRMDLAPEWWGYAKEKGVLCSINPDAHSAKKLERVWDGVAAARRGWLTPADILNCQPFDEVKRRLKRKVA